MPGLWSQLPALWTPARLPTGLPAAGWDGKGCRLSTRPCGHPHPILLSRVKCLGPEEPGASLGPILLLLLLLFSCVRLFVTQWTATRQISLSFTISWSLLKFMSIKSVIPSRRLSSPSPPALNLSQHQGLSQRVGSSHQVAKVLELQLQSISPSSESSGLISFRMDWLDLLGDQGAEDRPSFLLFSFLPCGC